MAGLGNLREVADALGVRATAIDVERMAEERADEVRAQLAAMEERHAAERAPLLREARHWDRLAGLACEAGDLDRRALPLAAERLDAEFAAVISGLEALTARATSSGGVRP